MLVSPYGVNNVKVRRPRALSQNKKRKSGSGTVIGHYFNFVCDTMDVLDKHDQFKGCHRMIDNVPIHKDTDIEKKTNRRGYG
jgi:hypothetical protein